MIAVILVAGGQAQFNPATVPDPYYLNEAGIRDVGWRNVNGRTLQSQSVDTGIRNLILITAGQSNQTNIAPSPYTPLNPTKIGNLNIYDGAIYQAQDPLAGAGALFVSNNNLGNVAIIIADQLITNGTFDRVIVVPCAFGGSTIADWTTGVLAQRLPIALRRIAQRGITAQANVTFAIIWGQGESDNQAGTSQASWTASFATLYAAAAAQGFTGRWFVAKETYNLGTFWAPVQLAQTSNSPSGVINNGASIYLGAVADNLVGNVCNGGNACRQVDNTHFTANGMIAYATDATNGWIAAMHASGAPF